MAVNLFVMFGTLAILVITGSPGSASDPIVTSPMPDISTYFTDYVTDYEDESNIVIDVGPLGTGYLCVRQMYSTHAHLYRNTSLDFKLCKCLGICPNSTQEELEEIYSDLVQDVQVHWNKFTYSYVSTYSVVLVVGTIGNILVLATVIAIFRPVSVTNMFIASLATADLLVCSLCVPMQMYRYILRVWKLGPIICKISFYGFYALFMSSVFSLIAMSLERFFVICYPMKAQYMSTPKRARIILAIVWPLAFAMASPVAVQAEKRFGQCQIKRDWADDDWSGPLYLYITFAVFALPAAIMGYCYIRTALALWRSIQKAKAMKNETKESGKNESKDIRSRISVIRMLIAIWIVFILCWGPYLFLTVIERYAHDWLFDNIEIPVYNHLYPALHLITMANSAMNPILYAFMSRKFRQGFIKVFLCCLAPIRNKITSSTASSTFSKTRSTGIPSSTVSGAIKKEPVRSGSVKKEPVKSGSEKKEPLK